VDMTPRVRRKALPKCRVVPARWRKRAYAYLVDVFTKRLHVRVTSEQRRRVVAEATRRQTFVGAVIRDAIDTHLDRTPREGRLRAVAEMAGMTGGRFLPPDEFERIVDEERENNFPLIRRRRR